MATKKTINVNDTLYIVSDDGTTDSGVVYTKEELDKILTAEYIDDVSVNDFVFEVKVIKKKKVTLTLK